MATEGAGLETSREDKAQNRHSPELGRGAEELLWVAPGTCPNHTAALQSALEAAPGCGEPSGQARCGTVMEGEPPHGRLTVRVLFLELH